MENKQIKEKLNEGWIHAAVIIEIIGKPKKHVEDTLKGYIGLIGENKNLLITKKEINKAKKHEKEFFATFADLEIMFKNLTEMMNFCLQYMPSSIEVIDPEELVYKARDISIFINDLQAKLHELDMIVKTTKQHNINLNDNFTKILKNFIAQACVNPRKIEDLENLMGVEKKYLELVINLLEKEKRIRKEGNAYVTIK